MTATVTMLGHPDIQSWLWFFDTEDEAHLFLANEREALQASTSHDYVDADVSYSLFNGSWKLRVDYIDHGTTPGEPGPLAA